MRSMSRLQWMSAALSAAAAAGCVKGTPDLGDDTDAVYEGGRVAVPGCGFDVVTVTGAEAPAFPETPVLGADPAPFHVHLGFLGDPRTTMGVVWRTDVDTTATTVEYGPAGGALDERVDGVTFRYVAGLGGLDGEVRIHEAHLCGLQPGTAYDYRVGGVVDGQQAWSEVRTFRTAPDVTADPSATVRVGVVGDSRGGYDVWADLAEQLQAQAVDLVVFSGDAVEFGQIQSQWDEFFGAAPELLASVPLVSAHGNHDLNSVNYFSQFAMPGNESDFSFDFGHAHFTVLNDSPLNVGDLSTTTRAFLEADLEAHADARWKVAVHHRPLWSSGTRHGSDRTLREQWGTLYDQHAVDLSLAGHDHIYERSRPMRGDEVQLAGEGTVYIVSGGAGAPLYGTEPDFFTEVSESTYCAGVIEIGPDTLSGQTFRRGEDTPFDTFVLDKTP
jgi:hypothetical protein